MKFKELYSISFDQEVKFDLFQSNFTIPETCIWQSLISLASLDEYLYHNMSDKVLAHRWNSDFIIKEFSVDDSIVKKVRQAYFNAIFKAHEYELNGLAESMFFEYDPLVNYDRTETQTHNETVETDDHTTTQNVGARSQTDSGRSDSSSNKTTAFDSGDYTKGTDKNDTTVGGSTLSTAASVDTTTEAGYTDKSNGGYTLRAKGNIGVTTSQQMLESERQVRMFNFFQKVAEVLELEMLVNDWETDKEEYVQSSSGGSSVDAYTKAEVNALLSLKADKGNTFTKSEVNDLLDDKADIDDIGTVASINLNGSTTQYLRGDGTFAVPSGGGEPVDAYTKEETDALLAEKLGVDEVGSVAFINLPDDPITTDVRHYLNAFGEFTIPPVDKGTKNVFGLLKIGNNLEMPANGIIDIPFKFGIDGDGNYGYYKADDSFVPFRTGGGEGSAGFLETCELNMPGKNSSSSGYTSIGCIATFSDSPTILNFRAVTGQTYEGQYIKVTNQSIYAKVTGRYLIEYYYNSGGTNMVSDRSIDVKNVDDLIYTGSSLGQTGTGIFCAYLGEDIEEPITNILYDGHISNTSRYLTPLTLQKSIFNYSYLLFEVRLNETKFKSCGIPNTAMNAQGQNNIQLGFSADGLTLNTVTYSGAYLDYYLTIRGVK